MSNISIMTSGQDFINKSRDLFSVAGEFSAQAKSVSGEMEPVAYEKASEKFLPGGVTIQDTVEISMQGMDSLRTTREVESEELLIKSAKDSGELNAEHLTAMRNAIHSYYEGPSEDDKYGLKNRVSALMSAYEECYTNVLEAHKDGDREARYTIADKQSVSLEDDLEALDWAKEWCLDAIKGYGTAMASWEKAFMTSEKDRGHEVEGEEIDLDQVDEDLDEFLEKIRESLEEMKTSLQEEGNEKGIWKYFVQDVTQSDAFSAVSRFFH